MKILKGLGLVFTAFLLWNCTQVDGQSDDLTQHVNPFIGTAPLLDPDFIGYTPPEGWRVWAGLVYPGASLPNAMVQLSPMTEYGTGSGYEYEAPEIISFTHTNKGHWNLCNIPVLPIHGDAQYPFSSSFSHDREDASPAFYQVYLEDYGIDVRLSTTLRTGIHEYTFDDDTERKVLFDLGMANNKVSDWDIVQDTERELSGFQRVGRDLVHFYVRLDHDITKVDKTNSGEEKGYAVISLSDKKRGPVTLRIGLSYVSVANAKENLGSESGDLSFDEIHQAGKSKWNDLLSKIKVKGGSPKETELFYTSLYRSFLWPALRSDVNQEFKDEKGVIQKTSFNYYTIPSFWDTYRNKLVLLGMISPQLTNDVIKSLIHRGDLTGFIPTFFHGDHAAPFITGSYLRGIKDFDVQKAFEYLMNNAHKEGGIRPHISEYIEKGFISDPDIENPHVETVAKAGVSKTLEYAYDDYSLALLAKELGEQDAYQSLIKRSQNYKNVFDKDTRFMRGRLDNGEWISPFDPQYPYYEYMYREANAWHLSFYVPHDMAGLVELYGGNAAFEEKLDSLFTFPWNPKHIARNVSSFIGQYCHGNQPDHEAPFSYHFIGKPEKSQEIIDNILANYYGVGDEGLALSGMDDAGEMSSWYVFAALGIYPLSPADPEYIVTVPIFDEVIWNLDDKSPLKIKTEGTSRKISEIKFNDKHVDGYFVPHEIFEKGGELIIKTK
ncbi:GH92 family glycosyl hydrolase [Belliella sp. DSM 111904]|uniref:GH92 family glycosyl hydrolase n=1 Tax=Belliella filtrata TaxID=2923435 RepID=A0ABS9V0L9_9BACT|nr:GH92 family glycosyl hydrolase [Belliella filtrata]MCH7409779.1 GH92 family glycosyl hydrolase [Belliella filtrata]